MADARSDTPTLSSAGAGAGAGTGAAGTDLPPEPQDLAIFVQSLLTEMQQKFQRMSEAIIGRIDDMGARIDDLEKSIAELMQQAGVEGDGKPEA